MIKNQIEELGRIPIEQAVRGLNPGMVFSSFVAFTFFFSLFQSQLRTMMLRCRRSYREIVIFCFLGTVCADNNHWWLDDSLHLLRV